MKVALAIVLVSVCLVGCANSWGFKWGRSSGGGRWSGRRNSTNDTMNNTRWIGVRRVDEEHPYFRSLRVNTSVSLNELKQDLRAFLNQTSEVKWMVKNNGLLMTRDIEVRSLAYKDKIEVWFANSGAPTRSETVYSFSRTARKPSWSSKGDMDKSKDERDKKGGMLPGGLTESREPTPGEIVMLKTVQSQVESQLGKSLDTFEIVQVATQVVAGTNYFAKVRTGSDSHVHIRVFKPLPHTREPLRLDGVQTDKTAQDELRYFAEKAKTE